MELMVITTIFKAKKMIIMKFELMILVKYHKFSLMPAVLCIEICIIATIRLCWNFK